MSPPSPPSITATAAAPDESPRPGKATSASSVVLRAGLPPALAELVLSVTGKCRLWSSERTDVARELCAHFRDGLEAGETPANLAGSFGDPASAARLITAARKRMRPLWWRSARATFRGVGAFIAVCLLLYAILAARFYLYSPNISRNFMREMNAPITQIAVSDRAWPLYIEARRQFGKLPEFMMQGDYADPRRPGEPGWADLVQWLDAKKVPLSTVRAAAARPTLGYVYRANMDPDLARAMEVSNPNYKYDPATEIHAENPLVIGILLPHLGEMRRYARWLQADAHLAASRNDAAAFRADIDALLGMAGQAMDESFLISDLVGIALADLAFRTIAREATTEGLFSREQLRDLAHKVGGFAGGRMHIDASNELTTVEDVLQRFYSDDGSGDGHFIGGPQMDELYRDWGVAKPRAMPLMKAVQPVRSVMLLSRAQVMDLGRRFVTAAAADEALPPWRHDERRSDELYAELMNKGLYSVVPFLASLQSSFEQGPVRHACASRDLAETHRATALAVIALQSFRLSNGRWPAALEEMVPTLLPALPLDPFDGRPIRYVPPASESELPRLYSVGADAVDDGGKSPDTKGGRSAVQSFQWFKATSDPRLPAYRTTSTDISKGDWQLWPEPPPISDPISQPTATPSAPTG